MHLNDAFGHHSKLSCTYNHHEQACSIAAEGYARLTGRVAAVCVTSGPGGTNALTGVLGGWQDSIPMFVVSGQVKRETCVSSTSVPLRQLGDQEFQIVDCAKTMAKYATMISDPLEIRYHLEKAWHLCNHGRKGPVWLDIPLDVQASYVEREDLKGFDPACLAVPEDPVYENSLTARILEKIRDAKRPVILAGTGIRLGDSHREFIELVDRLQIPVVTAWNAHDVIPDDNPYFCGRPGTVGTRGGNFVVQNCDVLLVLGSRLNIRQISYNYHAFAQQAFKIVVDIDAAELEKPTVNIDLPVHADVKDVMAALVASDSLEEVSYDDSVPVHSKWLAWARAVNKKYPATLETYYEKNEPINPYVFVTLLSQELSEGDVVACGNGSACVITFQAFEIKMRQRLFTNSGCAAMGYGFPAAIGCAIADAPNRVICIDGDGSFQMNIQELQTVVHHGLNLKTFIINNNGYHSIRQTQTNLFGDPLCGVCEGSGLSFPDLEKIASAYGLAYVRMDSLEGAVAAIKETLDKEGPVLCEVFVDPAQGFEPKLSSKILPDGKIVSPEIDDMFPFLSREEYAENKLV